MTARTTTALAWSSVLAAFGCIASGLPLMKCGSPAGLPLVVLFVVFIVATIVLGRLAKKKHGEEQGRISRWP